MSVPRPDLTDRAELGLPFESNRVVKRALMAVPWRLFVGRQVEFNRATAQRLEELAKSVRRLERRLDKLTELTESIAVQHRDSAAVAVREQLYDTEGAIRRDLSALQIEVARLGDPTGERPDRS